MVTFMSWPQHRSLDDTRSFIQFSDQEWDRAPAGPLLVFLRDTDVLIGSSGLQFEDEENAATGYIIAPDAAGNGYATEVTREMRALARELGVKRLSAACHRDHPASRRVLEKAGFSLEGESTTRFPNLNGGEDAPSMVYAVRF